MEMFHVKHFHLFFLNKKNVSRETFLDRINYSNKRKKVL